MRKTPVFLLAICFASSVAAAQTINAQTAYWTTKATVAQSPSVTAAYSCVTNYYVAVNGSDSNSGTSSAPWRTLSHAVAAVSAKPQGGVCVNVNPGTYTESLMLIVKGISDTPTGYIVFRSPTPQAATIQQPNNASNANVLFYYSKFVIFDGFNLIGQPSSGVVQGFYAMNSNHIKILNNVIHEFGSSGIVAIFSDYIVAQGNVVYDTSCCDSSGVSGIDLWEPVASDKNAGFHNVISNNVVYNSDDRTHLSEGHGIILDQFRGSPGGNYTQQTLIENNLVYNNGGAGILIWYSDNATVRNNTAFNNYRDNRYPAGEIGVVNSSHAVVVNNVAVANPTNSNMALWDQTWDSTNIGNVWANNVSFNGTAGQASVFAYGGSTSISAANGNILGVDPLLTNPAKGIFTLRSGSPAIGHGTAAYGVPALDLAGNSRSSPPDIGAYAYNILPPN